MAQDNQQGNWFWNAIKGIGRLLRGILKLLWKLVKLVGRGLRGIWRMITRKKDGSQGTSQQS